MCRTYVRTLDPLAVQRRNLRDVLYPVSIGAGASGGADAGAGEGAGGGLEVETLLNATELVAAMVEQEEGATSESALGTASPEVYEGSVVAPTKHKKRSECKPCHPQLWLKGKVFKRESIAGDAVLRRILEDTAGEKPAKVQDVLCAAGYHVTRKEITNHRERMALQAMEAPDVGIAEARGRGGVGNPRGLTPRRLGPGSARGRGSPRQGRARGRPSLPGGGKAHFCST